MKKINLFLSLFMTFVLIFGLTAPVINSSESICEKVFRLHIKANSDSAADQALKLKVRDCILTSTSDLFDGLTLEENIDKAIENKDYIENLCEECIKKEGYDYDVKVDVVKEFFDTRVYDDFTLPAGVYNSLKIDIGKGDGHNWWCIVFPAVCISACSCSMNEYLTDDEMKIIESKYSPKLKVVEIYEKIKSKLS